MTKQKSPTESVVDKKSKQYLESQLIALKMKYPQVASIRINYEGSGDSFGEFGGYECYDHQEKYIGVEGMDEFFNEQVALDDSDGGFLWAALEASAADFNNDGSFGYIIFDLVNMDISVDNYFRVVNEVNEGGFDSLKERLDDDASVMYGREDNPITF